ncbi:phosphatase PAP2 family protein [Natronococcus wangiae]|uniref:phosphatase PAP2 family protein n=1 Tax=Natronococcus wangiae TaxID=3068275 RepID=UPI00273F2FB2|nr:phosphatase PAP2 family protein [Natronococcus sp. AD5]
MNRGVGATELLRETLPEWTIPVFNLLSLPGDLLVIVPLLALLYLVDVTDTLRRSPETGTESSLCSDRTAFVIATILGGLALVVLVKSSFSLSRPPTALRAVDTSEYGFPSGHTMAATIAWGAVGLWATIGRRRARIAAAGMLVPLVGLSRLALGVHYLVDVLASLAIGVAYLAVLVWLTKGRPGRAFVVAIAIAALAVLVSGGNGRALLALAGTVGGGVGWWVLERPPVRRRLVRTVGRVRTS